MCEHKHVQELISKHLDITIDSIAHYEETKLSILTGGYLTLAEKLNKLKEQNETDTNIAAPSSQSIQLQQRTNEPSTQYFDWWLASTY